MRNTVILLSCVAIVAVVACAPETKRRPSVTGTAGTSGAAGTGVAGSTAQAGTTGAAGDTAAAGTTGQAGTTGAAGDTAAAGTTGQAGTTGAAGDTAAAGTTGQAGDSGAAGTAAVVACANSTVVTAGATEAKCPAKTGWVATADPTPAHRGDINDNQLMPKYAIDGSTTTRYSTGKPAVGAEYYQIDLGATAMISGITVDTESLTDMAAAYKVEVSTNGTDWGTPVAMCASPAASMEVINFAAKSARYVRFSNTAALVGDKWWSIHEVTVRCN